MMPSALHDHDTHQWLVPLAPELLVSVQTGELPVIEAVTPQLAAWVGKPAETLLGQPLNAVFGDRLPGLAAVVEQVFTSGNPVRDYRVSFTDVAGIERTVLIQAGMRPGKQGHWGALVALRLQELPAQQATSSMSRNGKAVAGLIGQSPALRQVFRKIEIYGPTDAPVVITGETGTGKELAARAIHTFSQRKRHPFMAVNCAALSEDLLESELFGHEKGAFTSAIRSHRGRFERAHEGTLFLDEIGEMPLRVQAKLLRVIEEGVIERVGGEREVAVDVRLVSATNVPLELAVQSRQFRLDLYHRLEVLRLHMPALRERLEDMPLLVEHFLQLLNNKYGRHIHRLTPEAIALLQSYSWPGNIRELRNVLERVYVETAGDVIGRKAFDEWVEERTRYYPGTWDLQARQSARAERPALIPPYRGPAQPVSALLPSGRDAEQVIDVVPRHVEIFAPEPVAPEAPQELTRERLEHAYRQAGGNITQAAKFLGVHKATLYRRMKALGLSRDDLDG
jgi:transcriptional regulator with GAF, ATPase, and Fis domain